MIYLDNNATTQVHPDVREAILPFLAGSYGNPSSTHRFGQESRQAIEEARHHVARLVGCEPREIIFTSGGTESDNAAIHGLLAARAPRRLVVTSTVEHSAVREPLAALAKSGGGGGGSKCSASPSTTRASSTWTCSPTSSPAAPPISPSSP